VVAPHRDDGLDVVGSPDRALQRERRVALEAHQVGVGDDAHEPAVVHHRDVVELALEHLREHVGHRGIGIHGVGGMGHHICHRRLGIAALRQDADPEIPVGDDPPAVPPVPSSDDTLGGYRPAARARWHRPHVTGRCRIGTRRTSRGSAQPSERLLDAEQLRRSVELTNASPRRVPSTSRPARRRSGSRRPGGADRRYGLSPDRSDKCPNASFFAQDVQHVIVFDQLTAPRRMTEEGAGSPAA
jgi:hypothetical protein